MNKKLMIVTLITVTGFNGIALAQSPSLLSNDFQDGNSKPDTISQKERYSYHFQATMVDMYHSDFSASYSGTNSLVTHEADFMSVTATIFFGTRLWKGCEIYYNPELSGGKGFSGATGIAGFPNGEIYRVGNPTPVISSSRYFLRQTFDLCPEVVSIDGGQNQLNGHTAEDRLVLTLGKFSLADMFDGNSYSHDPRSQFLNWAIMSGGAWDYASNTRGYTWGIVAELIHPEWSLKGAIVMEPEVANGPYMDMDIAKAHSENVEFDKMFSIHKQPGIARLIGFYNQAHMGSYEKALAENPISPDILQTRSYVHDKWGFVINVEQQINDYIGLFGRYSWDNGTSETWAFTEIDHSLNIGAQLHGKFWKRPSDQIGVALLINGLSADHRDYLAAGGYGFIIGDGHLNYGMEQIVELYYRTKVFTNFWLSPDYQFVLNPAYNKDRGPVINIFGIRGHLEF